MVKDKEKKNTITISDPKVFDCVMDKETQTISCKVKDEETFKEVVAVVPKKIEFTLENEDK